MPRIGIISDTHGLLRPEAISALDGCDHLLHAGDVGKPDILIQLATIAPITAIRGNVDHWASELADTELVSLFGKTFYLLHDRKTLDFDPVERAIDVVVSGHSHKPQQSRHDGVIYLNPGSAGPRRFKLPISLAIATIDNGDALEIEIINLL